MRTGLTARERRFLNYEGLPAKTIAIVERMTIDDVLEMWASLKDRGIVRHTIGVRPHGPACEQLSLDQVDRMMRGNRAPAAPANPEIGWTPDTEGSW
jgi:hypothetical protein